MMKFKTNTDGSTSVTAEKSDKVALAKSVDILRELAFRMNGTLDSNIIDGCTDVANVIVDMLEMFDVKPEEKSEKSK